MAVKHYDWTAHHAGVRGDKVAIVDLDTGHLSCLMGNWMRERAN